MSSSVAFQLLAEKLSLHLPASGIFTDPLYTLAKGTDAGFYRLIPGMVVRVNSEAEVITVIRACSALQIPLTFKAGGTSLSGQTITDSVLVEIGDGFSGFSATDNGIRVTLQCGITGGLANARLLKYNRRIGPDPASLNSARIGGIVSNNASGGGFGIKYNTYNTLLGMRVIFTDGAVLDTADPESRRDFAETHGEMLDRLSLLSNRVKSDKCMSDRIHHKYELKNTCGYGVNALTDFSDPIDIIEHLMVGAEGTLGFISEVTFETVAEFPVKATSLIFLPSLRAACELTALLKSCRITAAELMDRNALRSVQNRPGMPDELKELKGDSAALLIDTAAYTQEYLEIQISQILTILSSVKTEFPVEFTQDHFRYEKLWKVRKGLFTSAAAARPSGTACIIEDLAFRAEVLADALADLRKLTEKYSYFETVIWGHILDGNIHFVITPDFSKTGSRENYHRFMQELVKLTVHQYDGSLKGEHGTGRNMAPFVREEWGEDIYRVMQEVKQIFDPGNLLNPGVILNDDAEVHLKNIKSFPVADPVIDPCIECGFCEFNCPSKGITLTPRERIVVFREMTRLAADGRQKKTLEILRKGFQYHGDATCATDGLCSLTCPVEINTGMLIKELRFTNHGKFSNWFADQLANHMSRVIAFIRVLLAFAMTLHRLLGTKVMSKITSLLFRISGQRIPLWNPFMPWPAKRIIQMPGPDNTKDQVVYFPACINRAMGKSADYGPGEDLIRTTEALLRKAGYEIIYPANLSELCCGMAFDSKGFKKQGEKKARELESALLLATNNGKLPVFCDMSPCLLRMKETLDKRLRLYEPVEFMLTHFPDRLRFTRLPVKVAVHSTCSTTKMGLDQQLIRLAGMCASEVVVPDETGCCGWAGDRGFTHPELNASALKWLKSQLSSDVKEGYSTSRTCEIGLSLHGNISYKSIIYLVDKATIYPGGIKFRPPSSSINTQSNPGPRDGALKRSNGFLSTFPALRAFPDLGSNHQAV
jgi:D-lactate dehydrogenase